jgi:putative transposase
MASQGTRYKEEQIIHILKEVESGTTLAEVCRQYGVSEQTVYRWLFADGQEAQAVIEQ